MAQLVVAAAGAAIGAGIGGSFLGLSAAAWGWQAGSLLGSFLVKKPEVQGPRLGDLRVAGTEYGQPIPWVAGSPRIAGQVIWASRIREIANTQKQGKGGGGQKVTTYTYEVDLLFKLTENEVSGVSRIWVNGELVFGNGTTKSGVWASIAIYNGEDDQMPDTIYEATVGPGNAPAYRGGCTVRIQSLQLGQGKQIPNITFELGTIETLIDSDALLFANFNNDVDGSPPTDLSPFNRIATNTPGATSLYQTPSITGSVGVKSYLSGRAFWTFPSSGPDQVPAGDQWTYEGFSSGYALDDLVFQLLVSPRNGDVIGQVRLILGDSFNPTNGFRFRYSTPGGGGTATAPFDLRAYINARTFFHWYVQHTGTRIVMAIGGTVILDIAQTGGPVVLRSAYIGNANLGGAIRPLDDLRLTGRLVYGPGGQRYLGDAPDGNVSAPPLSIEYKVLNFGAAAAVDVRKVADDLMIRAGYDLNEYDNVALDAYTKPLRALAIGQNSNTRTPLEILQKAWFFEVSKSDKIYIRPRATTSMVTIPWEDLGAGEGMDNSSEPLVLQVGSDLEVPAQVALSYNNMESDYNVATEYSDRLISEQQSVTTVQFPLGMLSSEAKGVVDAMLFDQVAGLTTTTISVPLKYAFVEPGDVITAVNFDGREYRLRVITKRETMSVLTFECALDDVGALTSASITDSGYISVTDPARVAKTLFEAMDIPILRDADDGPGYYAAVGADRISTDDEWDGAVYVQAFSPNAYEQEFITGESCVMGECLTTLGNWTGGNVFDESNTLDVEVIGELSSTTRNAMLDDLTINAMKVGAEIIRFRFATLLSNDGAKNTYRLSSLLRGQRGTEWAIGGHTSGETCVLLNNAIRRVGSTLTQIGQERDVKGVTLNTLLSDVEDVQFTDTGVGLKPFSPANVVALASGSDVIVVTWQRRTRLAVRYGGAVDQFVPLGEVSEQYRVEIFDGSNLVRTETVTTPAYTYPAADIASDGFGPGDPITFSVSQLSAIVGAGYNTETEGIAP